jgi:hypothetical protein
LETKKYHLALEKLRESIFLVVLLANCAFDCYYFRCSKIGRKCNQFSVLWTYLYSQYLTTPKLLSGFDCWFLNMYLFFAGSGHLIGLIGTTSPLVTAGYTEKLPEGKSRIFCGCNWAGYSFYILLLSTRFWALISITSEQFFCLLGWKWQQSAGDTEEWQRFCKQWRSVTSKPFALFQCYSGRQLMNLRVCLLQHKCGRDRSAKGAVTVYIVCDCWRQRSWILCL